MSRHISGVAVHLQQLESTAIFVHCFAHCTNLCLQTLGRQSQCVHNALELVVGISQLIRYSPKRSSLFDTLRSQVSPGAPSLKPLSNMMDSQDSCNWCSFNKLWIIIGYTGDCSGG